MKVRDILECMHEPDLIGIARGKEDVFVGYIGMLQYQEWYEVICELEVVKIRMCTEVTHKEWKEKDLQSPILPDQAKDFIFRDMQIQNYLRIETV